MTARAKLIHRGYVAIETSTGLGNYSTQLGPYYLEFTTPAHFVAFIDNLDEKLINLIATIGTEK